MNKKIKQALAIGLTFLISAAYISGCGIEPDPLEESRAEAEFADEVTKAVRGLIHEDSEATEPGKEETVYTLADASGNPKETIVSAYLKNPEKKETLNDYTTLKNVENVMGLETFTDDGNGNLVWQADGADIYYEGTTDKELPVTMKITYKLDGNEVDPSELKGKSGHLSIKFDYTNNISSTKEVNGAQVEIYEPFIVISGLGFENAKAENITVSNGQLLDLEDSTLAVGFALPGLADSLGLNQTPQADDKSLPDSLTIEADVKDYSPVSTVTMIDNNLLRGLPLDALDSFAGVKAAANKLYSSSQLLADGSVKLYDGIAKLADRVPTLVDGVGLLDAGSAELFKGSEIMGYESGIIQGGLEELSKGTSDLYEETDVVSEGAYSLYEGAYDAHEGSAAISEGLTELSADISVLPYSIELLRNGVWSVRAALKSEEDESLYSDAASLGEGAIAIEEDAAALALGAESISKEARGISALAGNLNFEMENMEQSMQDVISLLQQNPELYEQVAPYLLEYQTKLQAAADTLSNIQTTADVITYEAKSDDLEMPGLYETSGAIGLEAAAIELGADSMKEDINTIVNEENLGAVSEGLDAVYEDSVGLDLETGLLSEGADTLQSSTSDVADGAALLSVGASDISDSAALIALDSGALELASEVLVATSLGIYVGSGILSAGLDKVHEGTETLAAGSQALLDGVTRLKDGMGRFHQEGIERIASLILGKGADLVERVKALKDMSNEYTTYAGNGTDAGDKVSFIIRTEGDEK